jgi:tRNA 2-thiocytidine biosynthesis protein TtcA
VGKDSATYRQLNRAAGKALHAYDMIADGDRILVGLSGGKDSLVLTWLLAERQTRVPIAYELFPVYIDPGFDGGPGRHLADFVGRFGLSVHIEKTDFGLRGHSSENRENPCFLCSRLRRQRLFEIADSLGCRKVALGHHQDDLIETLFLNMLYAGEMSTMKPAQPFFQGRFTVIRPLAFAAEDLIRRAAERLDFPSFENPCPSASTSKRRQVKEMLLGLYRSNRKIRGNIFRAMRHVNPEYLL